MALTLVIDDRRYTTSFAWGNLSSWGLLDSGTLLELSIVFVSSPDDRFMDARDDDRFHAPSTPSPRQSLSKRHPEGTSSALPASTTVAVGRLVPKGMTGHRPSSYKWSLPVVREYAAVHPDLRAPSRLAPPLTRCGCRHGSPYRD